MNSFSTTINPDNLFNIVTGKAVSDATSEFLLNVREKETSAPSHIDIEIIDGFHLLHNLGPSVPQSFGKIAEFILKKICNSTASEIHLIFDRSLSPSIKDSERSTRKEDEISYAITGPLQSRPTDFNKSLNNPKFKEQ
ncbi:hypothetical protein WA026_015459 [Henosepilachna vigintioctopunctata]|uniref:Macrophage migration inhibitory factor n=1 Tax=Henosepilachna vigintioctopunctata TaxID=420089 RepID=A0AAW1UF95_9CUCU